MITPFEHFGIVGSGAWGTALATAVRRAGKRVTLWGRDAEVVDAINTRHTNRLYLPDVPLDHLIVATTALADLAACDALLLVTPAQHLRGIAAQLPPLSPHVPLLICAKGIECTSFALLSEALAASHATHPLAILSGPSFAAEVARGLPAAITLALTDQTLGRALATALSSASFRPYLSDDLIGTQIGGAIKNVLAVACGIVEGRGLGDNARAAIITRGLSELSRLSDALGGRSETCMGLSGLGDLVLTCTGMQSRNLSLGYALGQGRDLATIMAERKSVAEGVFTAAAAVGLAARYRVELPICAAVHRILDQNAAVDTEITALLTRPLRTELPLEQR
jgi:glycerol-3-phosphate dehydrogenase (NAD(P)+)